MMRTLLTLLIIGVVADAAIAADDEPITFKGFALGVADKAAIEAAFPKSESGRYGCADVCIWKPYRACITSFPNDDEARKKCYELMKYGGVVPEQIWMRFDAGKLVEVSVIFLQSDFDRLAAAIRERFGEPTKSQESTVQNRMAATFPTRTAVWVRAGTILTVEQRGWSIDEGIATLTTEAYLARKRQEREQSIKAGAKSL